MTQLDLLKLERMAGHLLPASDLTLVVLKGHLLIEEKLEEIVVAHCLSPHLIVEGQVNFGVKLLFAQALTGAGELSIVWGAARRLNSLRNALAHKLDNPETQKRLTAFFAALEHPSTGWEKTDDAVDDLRRAVFFLYGALQGIPTPLRRVAPAAAV